MPKIGYRSTNAYLSKSVLDLAVPIVLYIDASDPGGVAVYGVTLASHLQRRGYKTVAICNSGSRVASMKELLTQAGIDARAIEDSDFSYTGRIRRMLRFLRVIREHKGCVLLLLLGNSAAGGPMLMAGVLGGARAIVRADLQGPMPPFPLRSRLVMKVKDLLVHRIVVGSQENLEAFVRHMNRPRQKFTIIHTGIDLPMYVQGLRRREVRDDIGIRPDTLVVGMVARLSEERKGAAFFVEMAAEVSRVIPSAFFLVVGDGPLRPFLEQQAEKLGIHHRIRFEGWRSDIVEVLASLDVFVMPSLYEGGPTIVLEAMAMGLPVVSTVVGMVPEIIDHGCTGITVPPGDSHALAQAVIALLADEQWRARLGNQAREKAMSSFSSDLKATRYLSTFADTLARRHS